MKFSNFWVVTQRKIVIDTKVLVQPNAAKDSYRH
jgi:hypothetical protein